jgi:type IV pilus assembly protein PilQ
MMQARIPTLALAVLFGVSALSSLSAQEEKNKLDQNDVQTLAPGDRNTLLTLRLKDRLLKDVVETIRRKVGVNIIMDDGIDETVSIDLEDVHWRTALNLVVEKAGCVLIDQGRSLLKVEKPPRVYFSFQNAPIQQVIDTIAKISGANIVVAPEVQGAISLRLRNIPWRDALDAAAKTLGYAVVEEDRGILRVVPRSNLREDLVTKSFQLRYVRPKSTYMPIINSPYVKNTRRVITTAKVEFELVGALRRVLTPDLGTLEYFQGSNLLVVKDIKPVIDEIQAIVNQIDVEPAQIFIDVRFVTTSNRDVLEYGVDIGDGGWSASIGGGQIPTRLPFNLGSGGFEDSIIADDRGTGPFVQSGNAGTTSIPNVIFGALNFQEVTAALRLLKQDVHSEIIQAPKLVALDHQEATIFVGETIRYAQARAEQGQAGGLQLVVEEAPQSPVSVGFQLLVVPHIVPGTDKIIMDVIPQSDALSGTGSSALAPAGFDVFTVGSGSGDGQIALPRVSSSTIATQVLLRSGQTAVLGGLMTDTLSDTVTQLPLLGDIPLLGWLFKHKNTNKTRTSLIVFVTPQLIRSPEEVDENIRRMMREREEMVEAERRAIFGTDRSKSNN